MTQAPEPSSPHQLDIQHFEGVLFDLDGVITDTAALHEEAWAQTFRRVFEEVGRRQKGIADFTDHDYRVLVDGQLRLDGVRNVLADRDIHISEGSPEDPRGARSAWAIANEKDAIFLELLQTRGPQPFPSSITLLEQLRSAGTTTALVSASRHSTEVLTSAGIADLFDAVVDGWSSAAMGLAGKPAPDTFIEAAVRLGARPERSIMFEDSSSGVTAGIRGGIGLVVGVDRHGEPQELLDAGAHFVVSDLGDIEIDHQALRGRDWRLEEVETDEAREGIRETIFTLANGYQGTRGARTYVAADLVHYPGTYFAGVYDRSESRVGDEMVEREAIVNAPNWLPLTFSIDGGPSLGDEDVEIIDPHLRLDLHRGLLERRFKVLAAGKRTAVLERRLVSMASPHLAAIELTLTAENWSGTLELRSGIDGTVADTETVEERLLPNRHLEILSAGEDPHGVILLSTRTLQSNITLAQAVRTSISPSDGQRRPLTGGANVSQTIVLALQRGARITCEKVVASYTSRDRAISEATSSACDSVRDAGDFASLLSAHQLAWEQLWRQSHLSLEGVQPDVSQTINLHLFHLLQVASPHVIDRDVGLGARGLHGEGYLGHVFWDEVFALPPLSLRFPETAQALLSYRYRRLDAARHAARQAGHAGAMFPWQSGSDGRDETPKALFNPLSQRWMPDRSRYQRHVGLAIAFNHVYHWQATGDTSEIGHHGAEVVLEIARFFSSLAVFDKSIGRYRIKGVMGPDEFHDGYPWSDDPGVDDNAYTNTMTAWLLSQACDLAEHLERSEQIQVLERIGCTPAELAHFNELSHSLYIPFHDGLISQFHRYEELEPIDLDAYRNRYTNIGRLDLILEAQGDSIRRYQVAKQADALMLLYLFSAEELRGVLERLGYGLSSETIHRTVDYYSERVTHGSSLSRIVHAWVAARRRRRESWNHFMEALSLDRDDSQGGTTKEGIHVGAMAGTVDILARCYTGLEVRSDALWLNPRLPHQMDSLAFSIQYRGHFLQVEIDHKTVRIEAHDGPPAPATILVHGHPYSLGAGDHLVHELQQDL